MSRFLPWVTSILLLACATHVAGEVPEAVNNSQNPDDMPLTPEESLKKMTVPEGFRATLFAGEPDVAQPIAMAIDDRGRLWVAECYSYPNWKQTGVDRILIFTDRDNDGRFDQRKVFADNLPNLSGLEVGCGGVWACCAPNLLFFPDQDRDDRPDGEPRVVLDGWTLKAKHNIFNGLTWGPDGWLYGLHGIVDDSLVGKPGTPEEERKRMNCGVWRYHPTREIFEPVAHGTTNPWGLDFNEFGEAFFTNCVIGHLWHVIPGAHYKRMYGQDLNQFTYQLLEPTSDHLHWGGGKWTESRGGKGKHSLAGGGHAHSGAMIYLGDNWPPQYRGALFTNNLHGRRVNNDILERSGSGYVGRHGEDLLKVDDPWFRGIDILYGPDGGVYVSDWHDLGECHDNDGVHRTSGRIFKVVYGEPPKPPSPSIHGATNEELVEMQRHANDWWVRQARLTLQQRAAAGRDMAAVHGALRKMYAQQDDVSRKLRALWALYVTGGASMQWLVEQLAHDNEHVRSWAVRLLVDFGEAPDQAVIRFARMAVDDPSSLVRLYLASALQRLPLEVRWKIAAGLASHGEDSQDPSLPLMIWYGIEPAVLENRAEALKLAAQSKIPLVRQFIAKRLAAGSQ